MHRSPLRPAVALFVVYAVVLVGLSGFKSAELYLSQIHGLEHWLGGDKWMHFKLSALLSILACFASERVLDLAPIKRILCVLCVLLISLVVDEALQYGVSSRRFELLDLAYGISGLLSGILGYLAVTAIKRRVNRRSFF